MIIKTHGVPNYQRFAETLAVLMAAREGVEIVPGSVKVTIKPAITDKEWEYDERRNDSAIGERRIYDPKIR